METKLRAVMALGLSRCVPVSDLTKDHTVGSANQRTSLQIARSTRFGRRIVEPARTAPIP